MAQEFEVGTQENDEVGVPGEGDPEAPPAEESAPPPPPVEPPAEEPSNTVEQPPPAGTVGEPWNP